MDNTGLSLVNSSGFPFQMRIAELIRANPGRHNWEVIAEEHPWSDAAAQQSGFIDIVAGFGAVYMVTECKRGAESTWLFLSDLKQPRQHNLMHVMCTDAGVAAPDMCEWVPMRLLPESPVAHFCTVRGQNDKEPMLERTGSTLLTATESLATEELLQAHSRKYNAYRFLIPVIVTTAQLAICRIDPNDVGLEDGRIDETRIQSEQVGMVRFSKAFGATTGTAGQSLEETHSASQRTILVVRASELSGFLDKMELTPLRPHDEWPQKAFRSRHGN